MKEISFYEITNEEYEKVICQILEKCSETGKFTFAKFADEAACEVINRALWIFKQKSFVPHGSINDPEPQNQPILLSWEDNILNKASLYLSFHSEVPDELNFERSIIAFYEKNEAEKSKCRELYKKFKNAGLTISYYKQSTAGTWEKIT